MPRAVDGAWTLDAAQDYIRLWDRLVGEAQNATDMFDRVREADPDKTLESALVLWISCLAQFPVPVEKNGSEKVNSSNDVGGESEMRK